MAAIRNKHLQVILKTASGPYELPVRFTRRRGIRHLKVSVDLYNEVVVNVPAHVADRHAYKFLQDQADWICDRLKRCPGTPSMVEYLTHRPVVSGNGREWGVDICMDENPRCEIDESAGRVRLIHEASAEVDAQLLAGLRAFAKRFIPERVAALAQSAGLEYKRLLVRDQRSRWGSCSEHGTLSFNWRLVMLPVGMHDYIIWHELAHLTHLNHSPAFWKRLATYDPQCDAHDAGISEWSSLLMRLGRNAPCLSAGVIKVDG